MSFLRQNHQPTETQIRWFAGLCVTSCCRRLEAALVGIHGVGAGAPIEIGHGLAIDLPQNIGRVFDVERLTGLLAAEKNKEGGKGVPKSGKDAGSPYDAGRSVNGITTPRLTREGREILLEIQEEALREILTVSGVTPGELLAVGVHDPGVWSVSASLFAPDIKGSGVRGMSTHGSVKETTDNGFCYCESLCDATGLALRTGHNIIDAFPARDLAAEGQGCPVFALPHWILLHSPARHRLMLDLGQEARITFLPGLEHGNKNKIGYGSAGACGCLLDPVVKRLTNGEQNHDDGGRLAVHGEQISELREFFQKTDIRQSQDGKYCHCSPFVPVFAARQISAIFEQAKLKNWSLRDVLSTLVHAVACRIARLMRLQFGNMVSEAELFVTGGGRYHRTLVARIQQELACGKLTPLENPNMDADHLDAVSVAILTSLNVDQIPGNLPHLTGAVSEQILGRLTPGTPQNWQRLLRAILSVKPAVRTLRSVM
ncbi:MAG: anhydro-N-acetylmuramic acid kinase [Planctomycetaceae bacterium]|nr:anhydro-N-acetylmuramic acid kinase [Planctomycetaceae bacterium]